MTNIKPAQMRIPEYYEIFHDSPSPETLDEIRKIYGVKQDTETLKGRWYNYSIMIGFSELDNRDDSMSFAYIVTYLLTANRIKLPEHILTFEDNAINDILSWIKSTQIPIYKRKELYYMVFYEVLKRIKYHVYE